MRAGVIAAVLGAIALTAGAADAEQELGPVIVSGEAQIGGRGVWGDTDSAKFDQYRDVHEGAFGSLRFLFEDEESRYYLRGWFDDIGENDQQYRFEGGRYGRWGIRGFYSEIPNAFSNQAVSPYAEMGDGYLALRSGFDRRLTPCDPLIGCAYNDQLTPSTSGPTLPTSLGFDTTFGAGEVFFRPTSAWDLSAGYRLIEREGNRPKALGFGTSRGNYINLAPPIDERTHEARADVQYTRETWNLGLNYTGSFFENDLDNFSADNPLTTTEIPSTETASSSALGRAALAPDNSAHLVALSGSGILPTSFPATLAGSLSWGLAFQDEDFLLLTSNQTILDSGDSRLDLPANDLDGRVQTLNGNLVFTARPHDDVNVKARYRVYDHDNETDALTFAGVAPNDRDLRDGETTIHYSYRRHNVTAEAAWRVAEPVTATLGFVWEKWQRDREREVRNLNEYGPTARIDWRASEWARLRASYTFTARRGSDYDALSGALDGLRKYSQADRLRHHFDLQSHFVPSEDLSLTLTTGFDLSNYDDSDQGLTEDDRFNVGIDASYQLHERVVVWANYSYDYIWALQQQGGGTWDSTTRDTAHNGGVGADFMLIPELLDGEISYFIQSANARTLGGGTAEDYPTIEDSLQAVTAALSVHPFENVTLRGIYRFEKYDRDNFHENFPLYTDTQGDIYLQNRIGDYDAHIMSLSAIFKF